MEKSKKDLISIIVTTYNSKLEYLNTCINSIINQTYQNLEIIIIDDHSNLDVFEKQKEYIKKNYKKNFIFLRNNKNRGVGYSLNKAIKISKGKYINWCSYDDYFHKDKIELQFEKIKNLKNTVVTCNSRIYYKDLNFSRVKSYKFLEKNKDAFIYDDAFSGVAFLIPRVLFNKCGFFNSSLRYAQDYDMWIRWYDYNINFININLPLFTIRIHDSQDSNIKHSIAKKEKENFYKNYFKKNFEYFFNFYSTKEIILFSNAFLRREFYDTSKFINDIFLKRISKKRKLLFFFYLAIIFLSNSIVLFISYLKIFLKKQIIFILSLTLFKKNI